MADITEAIYRTFLQRVNGGDLSALDEYLDPDYEEVWPQTGERVRGRGNLRAILENYPGGGLERGDARVVGSGESWLLTPNYTVVRVTRSGDQFVAVQRVRYPDQSEWYVVNLTTFRDGRAIQGESYFAPVMPAPPWRSAWVEPTS